METTELKDAAQRTEKGEYDPRARQRALTRMKQTREKLRKRIGEVNLVVPLLREVRDE